MRAITEFSNMDSWDAPNNGKSVELFCAMFHGFELFVFFSLIAIYFSFLHKAIRFISTTLDKLLFQWMRTASGFDALSWVRTICWFQENASNIF